MYGKPYALGMHSQLKLLVHVSILRAPLCNCVGRAGGDGRGQGVDRLPVEAHARRGDGAHPRRDPQRGRRQAIPGQPQLLLRLCRGARFGVGGVGGSGGGGGVHGGGGGLRGGVMWC